MTLPTGTISMSQVSVELGRNSTAAINLNDADVRVLAGKPSGAISMNDLRGKTWIFSFSITSNTTNANLRTLAVNSGWDQQRPVVATINSGVIISSNSTAGTAAAMTISGSWPRGVTLINNGIIQGRGGDGGNGGTAFGTIASGNVTVVSGVAGAAGGRALIVTTSVSIQNNGSIRGGGGGGGGGGCRVNITTSKSGVTTDDRRGGGGGGGGRSSNTNSLGGLGGAPIDGTNNVSGSAGGDGTLSSAGTRGTGGIPSTGSGLTFSPSANRGGNGGDFGAAGAAGHTSTTGSANSDPGAGGAAGPAVFGNRNITWLATGTRTGPIESGPRI